MVINGIVYKRSKVATFIVYNDLFIVCVYLIAIAYLKYMQMVDGEEFPFERFTCSDFSIEISPLPSHQSLIELKAELWTWIDSKLKGIL